jgi:3-deoxy-manno-octulosonate cytidylyltransferase (CMP-KDO synthetase)
LYAYTFESLKKFAELPASELERVESLEQNRWIEGGRKIRIGITEHDSIPVDTLDDLKRVRAIIAERESK